MEETGTACARVRGVGGQGARRGWVDGWKGRGEGAEGRRGGGAGQLDDPHLCKSVLLEADSLARAVLVPGQHPVDPLVDR